MWAVGDGWKYSELWGVSLSFSSNNKSCAWPGTVGNSGAFPWCPAVDGDTALGHWQHLWLTHDVGQ